MNLAFSKTAWTTSRYGEIAKTDKEDDTYVVGTVRADYIEPAVPTATIGNDMQITLGLLRRGLPYYDERYDVLRDYVEDATDQITTGITNDGTPWFVEPDRDKSTLVRCEPGDDMRYLRGYWGVITDGDDGTTHPAGGATYTLTIFILARLEEYNTPEDVREKFER